VAETFRKERVMTAKQLCACVVALLVFGSGIVPGVLAHDVYEDLGTYATGVDVYKLVCPSGTAKVSAYIYDYSGYEDPDYHVIFTVLLVSASTGKTALRNTPGGGYSSNDAVVTGGPGTYYVLIHKNKVTSTALPYYSGQWCYNSAGTLLANSSHTKVQDQ
jgi:hypothetical protein